MHRRGSDVEPGSRQDAGDASRPHRGAQRLEPTDEVRDELRKPADRLSDLDEGVGTFLVEAPVPVDDGQWRDEQVPGGLGERPAPRGSEFQDGEPLDGRVVGPALGRDWMAPERTRCDQPFGRGMTMGRSSAAMEPPRRA